MKLEPCSMATLVEAKRDGRLGDRELSSIDRHLATCGSCAELGRELDQIRVLLRSPAPVPTPLEVQRGRLKLLREAALSPASPSVPVRRRAALVAAIAFATVAALILVVHRRSPEIRNAIAQAPSASAGAPFRTVTTVVPENQTRFTRTSADGTEIVRLSDGAVSLSVRHLGAGERFLVRTGDAEVEVRGTVFRVEAENDRVRSVSVREGMVEVRFRGATFFVTADERWDRPADAPPVTLPAALASASAEPAAIAPLAASLASSRAKRGPIPPRAAPSAKPAPEDGSAAFVDGMGMVERGDYGAAAKHLDAFSRNNPNDDRAEDAAFLVVIALQRAGRSAEAVAAARRYLATYPSGFRRAQAQAIADAP
jgi:hypothetical protein